MAKSQKAPATQTVTQQAVLPDRVQNAGIDNLNNLKNVAGGMTATPIAPVVGYYQNQTDAWCMAQQCYGQAEPAIDEADGDR